MMLLTIYLIIINIIGFLLMGIDKRKARKQKWRIAESRIWLVAIIGGAFGATAGMNYFRHKTKHTSFRILLPLLTLVDIGLLIWYFYFLS
ncbi:Uncharacterized membrane protein YsdA, DUF1294 family [Gracilibacillus ureilyticus]|uniref:Uncharacterized membrane protein YsdA, DUF1294 family n=2 Tax=Gracilibacillus ureilyticus TaxID=531814 RepID=A0A1H9UFD7_9BACI|nr:Uncharacterized membrane protein YsdA, DUF1294 family [Gracilibacillus ureilyticus]